MKNYNIYTVLSGNYYKFGLYFLYSLYDVCDIDRINNIFIVNSGLSLGQRKTIKHVFDKVKFIKADKTVKYVNPFVNNNFDETSLKWLSTINLKTIHFRKLLLKRKLVPIFMIDSDMLFLKDIGELINDDFDILTTIRPFKFANQASFILFNTKKSITSEFIDNWIKNMEMSKEVIKETAAFSKTIDEYEKKMKIKKLSFNTTISERGKTPDKLFHISTWGGDVVNKNHYLIHFKRRKVASPNEMIKSRTVGRGFQEYIEKYDTIIDNLENN